jgi:hypothetical protein
MLTSADPNPKTEKNYSLFSFLFNGCNPLVSLWVAFTELFSKNKFCFCKPYVECFERSMPCFARKGQTVHRYFLGDFVENNMFLNKFSCKESKFLHVQKDREKEAVICR